MTTAALPRRSHSRFVPVDQAPPPQVALYLRQSQDTGQRRGEVEGLGVARQEVACRELAARRGWDVDPELIFTDNSVSASKRKKRPAYSAMVTQMQRGRIDVVIVWAVDRLLRRLADLEELIDLAEGTHVKIVTCQGDLDLESPSGRMNARVLASAARFEAEQKGARQHLAEVQAMESGRPPRRRAFGYKRLGLEPEPAEAEGVREAYKLLLAGASLRHIATMLNTRGTPTTLGREWEPTAVRTLLLNARNAAIRTYYGEEAGPGNWPPIIDEQTFRQAQAVLNDPARRTSGGSTSRKHLGASLYTCGVCAEAGTASTMRTAYRGAETRVYICATQPHLSRLAEPIDEFVTAAIEAKLRDSATLADALSADDPELAALHGEADTIRARIRRIEADYGDGEISARIMREQIDRHNVDLRRIETRMAALTRSSRLAALAASPDPVADWRALDVNAKQAVAAALAEIVILRGKPGRKPFDPDTVRIDWRF